MDRLDDMKGYNGEQKKGPIALQAKLGCVDVHGPAIRSIPSRWRMNQMSD